MSGADGYSARVVFPCHAKGIMITLFALISYAHMRASKHKHNCICTHFIRTHACIKAHPGALRHTAQSAQSLTAVYPAVVAIGAAPVTRVPRRTLAPSTARGTDLRRPTVPRRWTGAWPAPGRRAPAGIAVPAEYRLRTRASEHPKAATPISLDQDFPPRLRALRFC